METARVGRALIELTCLICFAKSVIMKMIKRYCNFTAGDTNIVGSFSGSFNGKGVRFQK